MAIAVLCPGCKVRLTVEENRAGEVLDCPNCDLRIRIPAMLPPATSSGSAKPQAGQSSPPPAPTPTTAPAPATKVILVPFPMPTSKSRRRDDDDDDDDDDDYDDRRRRRRRRNRFRCPYCGTGETPVYQFRIAPAGWILFAVLLVMFFPLCFIGLFIKERYIACYNCGSQLI